MATSEQAQQCDLLVAIRAFVTAFDDPAVTTLAEPLFHDDLQQIQIKPQDLPALAHLSELDDFVFPMARPLFQALGDVLSALRWQVSYSVGDGFTDAYLRKYAWCDVIGPEGVFRSDDYRMGFGYWRQGIQYPTHHHEPEEIYLVLAGSGIFTTGDASPQHCGPGSVVHHAPFQPHSIDMSEGPLLVLFIWHGRNLHKKSEF